jgi:hypothetical protein
MPLVKVVLGRLSVRIGLVRGGTLREEGIVKSSGAGGAGGIGIWLRCALAREQN